ncbi:hypothetical protein [Trichodesmium erythraeum]|nr:hypothetical protein [Trichodesmium erythraeum GBRTRLIN201]MDT9339151.1 hypothetical protein [Trichodesmium erythraeum 21-75]
MVKSYKQTNLWRQTSPPLNRILDKLPFVLYQVIETFVNFDPPRGG